MKSGGGGNEPIGGGRGNQKANVNEIDKEIMAWINQWR